MLISFHFHLGFFSTFSSSVFRLTVSNAFYMSIINIIRLKFSDVIAFSISSFMHMTLFSCVSSFFVGCLIFWYMIFQFFPSSFYMSIAENFSTVGSRMNGLKLFFGGFRSSVRMPSFKMSR